MLFAAVKSSRASASRLYYRITMRGGAARESDSGRLEMADKHLVIGHLINFTGMIGVASGIFLFTIGIVPLLFRHWFGFNVPGPFHWFW
jgi:hypothetical protein